MSHIQNENTQVKQAEEVKPIKISVIGGTEDERIHLAFIINTTLRAGNDFAQTKLNLSRDGIDHGRMDRMSPYRLEPDAAVKVQADLKMAPITIVALNDNEQKDEADHVVYRDPIAIKLYEYIEKLREEFAFDPRYKGEVPTASAILRDFETNSHRVNPKSV